MVICRFSCDTQRREAKHFLLTPKDSDLRQFEGKAFWGWSGFVISWTAEKGAKRITIEEFLDRPLGLYPDEKGLARTYTPKQLIKYTANKEGVAHLS
jgi:hypothetical protein